MWLQNIYLLTWESVNSSFSLKKSSIRVIGLSFFQVNSIMTSCILLLGLSIRCLPWIAYQLHLSAEIRGLHDIAPWMKQNWTPLHRHVWTQNKHKIENFRKTWFHLSKMINCYLWNSLNAVFSLSVGWHFWWLQKNHSGFDWWRTIQQVVASLNLWINACLFGPYWMYCVVIDCTKWYYS